MAIHSWDHFLKQMKKYWKAGNNTGDHYVTLMWFSCFLNYRTIILIGSQYCGTCHDKKFAGYFFFFPKHVYHEQHEQSHIWAMDSGCGSDQGHANTECNKQPALQHKMLSEHFNK